MSALTLTNGIGTLITSDPTGRTITVNGVASDTIKPGTVQIATAAESTAGAADNKATSAVGLKQILSTGQPPSTFEGVIQTILSGVTNFTAPRYGSYFVVVIGGGGSGSTGGGTIAGGGGAGFVSATIVLAKNEVLTCSVGASGGYSRVTHGSDILTAYQGGAATGGTPGTGGTATFTGSGFYGIAVMQGEQGSNPYSSSYGGIDVTAPGGYSGNHLFNYGRGGSAYWGTNSAVVAPATQGMVLIAY